MKIEIWSDILCPFCYIGKRRLEQALEQFPAEDKVEIIYRSFELNPDAPKSYSEDIHAIIAKKYGISYAQSKANNDKITEQAATLGLDFQMDTMKSGNSFDAHRLIHFAGTKGKMAEMKEQLLHAYFTESKNVSEHQVLIEAATTIGLNREEVLTILDSDIFTAEVRRDEMEAQQLQINSVPFFVFDRKYAISGAQPLEAFMEVLESVTNDSPFVVTGDTDGGTCTDESCELPNKKE